MYMVNLFVYGTLKKGYWNHDKYCRSAILAGAATVRGRLYELPSGIPVLQVPDDYILAIGTRDVSADIEVQEQQAAMLASQRWELPVGSDVVYGELLTFDDPSLSIPPIDRLEGFRPGQPSLYRRVLTSVFTEDGIVAAWVYVTDSEQSIRSCRRLEDGRWEQESEEKTGNERPD
jgi:gamma-glutamylcyclotransferase (GGCT)/AIG2-like uncharacterized protein YtfP